MPINLLEKEIPYERKPPKRIVMGDASKEKF
jgi:hypothetical protein